MKFFNPTIGAIVIGLLPTLAYPQQACYLPTNSNVSYTSVIELATSSPTEVISYGEESLQYAELWLPQSFGESNLTRPIKHPLVIFIHGGCWLSEYDIRHTHALSTGLANAGYAVWSVEYRRYGDTGGGWPGSYKDIITGIKHAKTLDDYPIDLNSIAVVGHSAGGHLALLAGAEPDLRNDIDIVIGLAPIFDLEAYALGDNSCQTATPKFMGGTVAEVPASYAQANPARKSLHPNTHVLQGNLDQIVPISQSQNKQAKLQIIKGAGHFDHVHPGTPAFQTLLKLLAKEL